MGAVKYHADQHRHQQDECPGVHNLMFNQGLPREAIDRYAGDGTF